MTMKDNDLWLAGILEGEGCFHMQRNVSTQGRTAYPHITIAMSDEDVINRVAGMFGNKYRVSKQARVDRPREKPIYRVTISGTPAAKWMLRLQHLMGNRRRSKIHEVLSTWLAHLSDAQVACTEDKSFLRRVAGRDEVPSYA